MSSWCLATASASSVIREPHPASTFLTIDHFTVRHVAALYPILSNANFVQYPWAHYAPVFNHSENTGLRMASSSSRATAQSSALISTLLHLVSHSRRKDDAGTATSSRPNMLTHQVEGGGVLDTPVTRKRIGLMQPGNWHRKEIVLQWKRGRDQEKVCSLFPSKLIFPSRKL